MENTFWDILGTVLSLVVGGILSHVFIVRPELIIQLQARFYQTVYRDMDDEQIDSGFQLPWDKALMGRRSGFVHSAADNPEKHSGLLLSHLQKGLCSQHLQ